MRRLKITTLVFLFLASVSLIQLNAQDEFEDLISSQGSVFEQLQKQGEEELQRLKTVDKEFADTLNKAWKELDLETGIVPDETPKPVDTPVARPPDEMPKPEPVPPKPKPVPKVIQKQPHVTPKAGIALPAVFFDTPLAFNYDKGLVAKVSGNLSAGKISAAWETMGSADYESFIQQANQAKAQLKLNDWGYGMLIDTLSGEIHKTSASDRNLFTWFILVKSGYDARIGYAGNKIYLLMPSANILYGRPFFKLGGKSYYVVSFDNKPQNVGSISTYEGTHKEAIKQLDMRLASAPDISKKLAPKTFTFVFSGKEYSVPVQVNSTIVAFYDLYPLTNLDIYFSSLMTEEVGSTLLAGLKPIVAGKSETEGANILLRFVQTAFAYKTDGDQFGREKPFFKEETFYYPFSDCEDRSFLFAYLVKNLLGLDVIGLDYPGHVATAVRFTSDVSGDGLTYQSKRYVICDPTYINANLGECMPKFKKVTPGVINM